MSWRSTDGGRGGKRRRLPVKPRFAPPPEAIAGEVVWNMSQRLATMSREQIGEEAALAITALLHYGQSRREELSEDRVRIQHAFRFAMQVLASAPCHPKPLMAEKASELNVLALQRMVDALHAPASNEERQAIAAGLVAEVGAHLENLAGEARRHRLEMFVASLAGKTDEKFFDVWDDLEWVGQQFHGFTLAKPRKGQISAAGVLAKLALRVGAFGHSKRRSYEQVCNDIGEALRRHRGHTPAQRARKTRAVPSRVR